MVKYLEKYMELTKELVDIVSEESGFPVIICGEGGRILAATDRSRIGNIHKGAARVVGGEVDEVSVTLEQEEENKRQGIDVRAGHNQVIFVNGIRCG
ncbi:MAG: sugar diacid recognition domain-containing protein, partial [Bacillota bacterium]|nr:sugar diacid recognition domain-containing protein [Bacillota bacterium]